MGSVRAVPLLSRVEEFAAPAPLAVIEKVAAAIRANNIDARVVETAGEARLAVLELMPEGAEVHSGKSKTLSDVGLYQELFESGRYDSLRDRT
ncbi:MAG: LUD domain-containing protein [Candidatus Dormiibacterota bacterium]